MNGPFSVQIDVVNAVISCPIDKFRWIDGDFKTRLFSRTNYEKSCNLQSKYVIQTVFPEKNFYQIQFPYSTIRNPSLWGLFKFTIKHFLDASQPSRNPNTIAFVVYSVKMV